MVEVLSPIDQIEDVQDKIRLYLDAGVSRVWLLDPWVKTVTVHRSDRRAEVFQRDEALDAEPHLPGFRVKVSELLADISD